MRAYLPPTPTWGIALVTASLLTAGCGGSSAPRAPAQPKEVLAYSHCMRAHGVPGFPDPDRTGGIEKQKIIALGNPPQVVSAQRACFYLMPRDGLGPQGSAPPTPALFADMLSFARCVRDRGVLRFPDPTAQGSLTVAMVQAQGLDVHSPEILAKVKACLPASHGALTLAQVRRSISEAGG